MSFNIITQFAYYVSTKTALACLPWDPTHILSHHFVLGHSSQLLLKFCPNYALNYYYCIEMNVYSTKNIRKMSSYRSE